MKNEDRSTNWAAALRVVLVRPEDDGNIGAVCRAMKTTGLNNLTIIGRKSFDTNRVRTFALHAYGIFEQSELYPDLHSALNNSVLSVGMTRRTGKRRKYISYSPDILPEKVQSAGSGIVNLVFGNEEHGLTDAELACCDTAVSIPSSAAFPSYNLSHAVQIIGYLLFSAQPEAGEAMKGRKTGQSKPAERRTIESAVASIIGSLENIGFFSFSGEAGKDEMARFFRDICARALVSPDEAERLADIFVKAEGLSQQSTKKP